MIQIDARLKGLAEIFSDNNNELYAVGSYVRNQLIGLPVTDIDICGTATPDVVMRTLNDLDGYTIIERNKVLGTIEIHISGGSGKLVCEYTTFRRDSYRGGHHTPEEICFTRSIDEDALRRDFTVNAIYADLLSGRLKDPLNGLADLKKHRLRTVSPSVFCEDGLRILRMLRFAAQLDWEIEEATLASAKENAHLLKDISKERIFEELKLILTADKKYRQKDRRGLEYFLQIMSECGIDKQVFAGAAIAEKERKLCGSVSCDLTLRFAALLSGSAVIRSIMYDLKAPKQLIKDASDVVRAFHNPSAADYDIKKLLISIGESNAKRLLDISEKSGRNCRALSEAYRFLADSGLFSGVQGLKVNGDDCIARGLFGREAGQALDALLSLILNGEVSNDRTALLEQLDIMAGNKCL